MSHAQPFFTANKLWECDSGLFTILDNGNRLILPSNLQYTLMSFVSLMTDNFEVCWDLVENQTEEETKKIKIVLELLKNRKIKEIKDWVSKNETIMGRVMMGFVFILNHMNRHKTDDGVNFLQSQFYRMLTALENNLNEGLINEGGYLKHVETASKVKKIIDTLVSYDYITKLNDCYWSLGWVSVVGYEKDHLQIVFHEPEPITVSQ